MKLNEHESCINPCTDVVQPIAKQSYRPVEKKLRDGKNLNAGCYTRIKADGSIVYWARVVSPATGKWCWTRAVSLQNARDIVRQSKNTRTMEEARSVQRIIDETRSKRVFASVGDVHRLYMAAADAQRIKTGKPRESSARHVWASVKKHFGDHFQSGIDAFPKVVERFVLENGDGMNRESLASVVKAAKAMCARWAMSFYREHSLDADGILRSGNGLVLPPQLDWSCAMVPRTDTVYRRPPEELVKRTVEEGWKELENGRTIGLAFMLCYCCGMSARDAAVARWDWMRDGWVHYRRVKTGKSAEPLLDEKVERRWTELAGNGDPHGNGGFVLPGSESVRHRYLTSGPFAWWMKELGWTTNKKAHELRKLASSKWMADFGPAVCCQYSGDTIPVLMRYYVAFVKDPARERPRMV